MKTTKSTQDILHDGGTALDLYKAEEQRRKEAGKETPSSGDPVFMSDEAYRSINPVPDIDEHCYSLDFNFGKFTNKEVFYSWRQLTGTKTASKLFPDASKEDEISEGPEIDYDKESINRTKKIFTRLLKHNYSKDTLLGTLTFAKAVHDIDEAWHAIHMMAIRYKAKHGHLLNYIAVPELHPGGHGWHFHVVINVPWIDFSEFIHKIWKLGFVKFSPKPTGDIHELAGSLAGYLVKYLTKAVTHIPKGKRRYSRGGDWRTDWLATSALVGDIEKTVPALLAYLQSQGVKYDYTKFEPHSGQFIHKIAFSTGVHPDLDLTPFLSKPERPRSCIPHPKKGKENEYTQEEFQYEV